MSRRLYIIHGWAYSIEPWNATVELLRKAGIDVVQLRVPGLTAPSDDVWTIDGYVRWLERELDGIDKPVVLGHSNGGRIALHFAAQYPDRLDHLILLSSAGIEVAPVRLSRKRQLFKSLSRLFSPLKYMPFARRVVHRALGSDYGSAPSNMKKTLANMLESDRNFDATNVTTPTSIIWGDEDRTTPLAMARKLQDTLPNSTLVTKPEWAHAPYKTHPEQLAETIIETLGNVK